MNFLRLYLGWTNEITRSIFILKNKFLFETRNPLMIKSGNTDNCSACENKYMKRKSLYMI
jgi:hypothetical protein